MHVIARSALGAMALVLLPTLSLAQSTQQPAAGSAPTTPPAAVGDPQRSTAPAAAPGGEEREKGRGRRGGGRLAACRAEAKTLCPDAKRGERRQCLTDNAAKLSPECSAALAALPARGERGQGRGGLRKICSADVQQHCADTVKANAEGDGKRGRGRAIMQCLRANLEKLSPECGKAVEARGNRGKRQG